jgi:hypothetical protein
LTLQPWGGKNILAYRSHLDPDWKAVRKSVAAAFGTVPLRAKVGS